MYMCEPDAWFEARPRRLIVDQQSTKKDHVEMEGVENYGVA
jgi:hypothetical protein